MPPAASPELKNKSTVRPDNIVENSLNSAVAKKDRSRAGKYTLNTKPTSTNLITKKRSIKNKQQQASLPKGSFGALDNESATVTVSGK
jgi:hypothetical protein